jgi:NAD(P)-dependent dehydrogenase (short-subunit alcohol dehydrogenase family)
LPAPYRRWYLDELTSTISTTPFRLDGRAALVTGGASGIGEATCRAFTRAGASVIIADLDRARAEALAAGLPGASTMILDICDESAVKAALAGIGRLDILVNNAGIGLVGNVEETELADFQRLFRVNVDGTFLLTKYALPLLLASGGSIVNIGSVAGVVGVKKRFAYCATKGAVVAMTRQLAVDYPTQIRVNCICPGTVDSPFVEGYLEKYHKHEKEKVRAELNLRQPIGRLGRPEEIASLALYLCSPEAAFVNGSIITIDGGWTAA